MLGSYLIEEKGGKEEEKGLKKGLASIYR